MDRAAVSRRLRNSIEWSSSLALAALGVNVALGMFGASAAKKPDTTSVLVYLAAVALATGFFFFLSLVAASGLVDDEKLTWAHALALPAVYVAEVKTLLLLLGETKLNVRFIPELALGDQVANHPATLAAIGLVQAAVLAVWVWSGRQKPQ